MILSAKNIRKAYSSPTRVVVLNGISLTVVPGEAIAIMGKSGEGKSTLLHILGTLEQPCSGELTICGHASRSTSLAKIRNQHIGFVFQSCHLLEEYTALENVLMPARIGRETVDPGSPAYQRGVELLEAVGLKERTGFLSKFLSGGERQRVAIARALCNDPELILADEPSGNLDHLHSQAIHDLLLCLTKERGKSLIVVTHDQELAALCDRIFILKDGMLTSTLYNF